MTKPELLSLMRLLSALESVLLFSGGQGVPRQSMPDYLLEDIGRHVEIIEQEILK